MKSLEQLWLLRFLLGSLAIICSALAEAPSPVLQPSSRDLEAESERAFAQEREADVVVFYDTGSELYLQRPERKQPFASEKALLTYLTEFRGSKRRLVVVLSKRQQWSDPKQTLDGFWQLCKKAGFERVFVQQGSAFGRGILHE